MRGVNLSAFRAEHIRVLEQATIDIDGDAVLMQRAAAGLARSAAQMLRGVRGRVYGTRVLLLVGAGNNGGDALYAGTRLAVRGAHVDAARCLGEPHLQGRAALLAAGGRLLDLDQVDLDPARGGSYDLVIDGVLGIGGRPGLPATLVPLTRRLTELGVPVLAVDLPSGVDTDSGAAPEDVIRATRTVTFGALKPCHLLEPAASRCGEVELVDIGLDRYAPDLSPDLVGLDLNGLALAWPYPDETSSKYTRGVVGIDTGSEEYPGAAVMSTFGAVYAGAGMVRFLGAERPAEIIGAQLPNVVFAPGRIQAHLLGSGWGQRPDGAETLAQAAADGLPAVVDADGLNHLPESCPANWLLTPHAGELAILLETERSWVEADPVRAAVAGAQRTGATVLLKGASQVVASPGASVVRVALPGPAWTAQAGSGDVLGGVCAALLAAGLPPDQAGQLGASVQAAAAARHPGVVPPADLARMIGTTLGELERRGRELGRAR